MNTTSMFNKTLQALKLFQTNRLISTALLSLFLLGLPSHSLANNVNNTNSQGGHNSGAQTNENQADSTAPLVTDTIIVAGGCFWCVESDFEKHPGVISAVSGYINGTTANPTYKQVVTKKTGHFEAVEITFDTAKTNAKELTEYYWATIDPTDPKGQFCDKGSPYKTALFYQNDEQRTIFENSLTYLNENKPFDGEVVTEILAAKTFYRAEEYHQDYYKKSRIKYKYYRHGCGRDARIKQLWGEVASKEIDKLIKN
jgi:peptide-methionine (S)-S-oxide reductase